MGRRRFGQAFRKSQERYFQYFFLSRRDEIKTERSVRLTDYTDYALRLLMYLALREDQLTTVSEVAASYGISRNHLMKVASDLGAAGFIKTVRGRGGGLKLAKASRSIRLGDVVRCTEPNMALVACFEPIEEPCAIRSCCVLRGALQRARSTFLDVLDGYSLADLVRPRNRLRTMLAIAPPDSAHGATHNS
jgi:Rrf2 family transcriptional regulator, nitric oxide-sensitive transcriptional repressor